MKNYNSFVEDYRLFPINKVKGNHGNTMCWILFNTKTEKFITTNTHNMIAAQRAGYPIAGVTERRIKKFFSGIRYIEDAANSDKDCRLVFARLVSKSETKCKTVDENCIIRVMTEDEIVNFIRNGNILLGAGLDSSGKVNYSKGILVYSINEDKQELRVREIDQSIKKTQMDVTLLDMDSDDCDEADDSQE